MKVNIKIVKFLLKGDYEFQNRSRLKCVQNVWFKVYKVLLDYISAIKKKLWTFLNNECLSNLNKSVKKYF